MTADFLEAYEENVWHVHGYLAYRTGSRADAEDLTQITFERALKAWSRFDPSKATAKTWLLKIAHNIFIDHRRRQRARPRTGIDISAVREIDLPQDPGPFDRLHLSPELDTALQELSRRERAVIGLRFGADLRAAEIAEMLDLSVSNTEQILSRTLRKLHASLAPVDLHDSAPDQGQSDQATAQ
jgi:RNA polymerase sigma factor (sigma-70 family)